MILSFELRNVYGRVLAYPTNEPAKAIIAASAPKLTYNWREIQALGEAFEIQLTGNGADTKQFKGEA